MSIGDSKSANLAAADRADTLSLPETPLTVEACDLAEATRYLPVATAQEQAAFAFRQLRARRRATVLLDFYRRYSCNLTDLHRLTACAVTLGRFAGYSAEFDEMGEEFMPVDANGGARTIAWKAYIDACVSGRPRTVRDELWTAAHMQDMEHVRDIGLEKRFQQALAAHAGDPVWALINQHMEATLGTRLMDRIALDGTVAYETALAHSLSASFLRLCTVSWRLVGRYWWEGVRAVLLPSREPRVLSRRGLATYRRLALESIGYSFTVWNASRVYRRGMRERERGSLAADEGWPLLAQVLGERLGEVDPLIVAFYQNPARFRVKVQVELLTMPAKFWSRMVTYLVGQGLYEGDGHIVDAKFRVFRRSDGSMHFLRELYVGETLRVFDSDFVVRNVNGAPALFEVFVDKHVDIEMNVTPLPGKGLSIRGKNVYFHGVRIPCPGIRVEFQSHVSREADETILLIEGQLKMQPETRWGEFLARRILRRPEVLGRIRYTAWPLATAASASANSRFS